MYQVVLTDQRGAQYSNAFSTLGQAEQFYDATAVNGRFSRCQLLHNGEVLRSKP